MQCPNCNSEHAYPIGYSTFNDKTKYTFGLCHDCEHTFKLFNAQYAPCDIKVITEAISEPAGIPVTVYERISTGEIFATPTALFNRGRHV